MSRMIPFCIAAALFAAPALTSAASLTVRIDGLRVQSGQMLVSVVGSADAWNGTGKPAAATARTPGDSAVMDVEFADLPPGDYAVRVLHDENGNGKMDSNPLGMPLEGYGFSNNPMVMRPATFDEARFTVGDDGALIIIALR